MSEAATLVSWDAPQDLGKIPDSDWMCPVGSLEAVASIESNGGVVTDETIRNNAQGRQQHLELLQFPEGYQAVKVMDSATSRVLTGIGSTHRYGGLITCCGAIDNTPFVIPALEGKPISMSGDREIASVDNLYDGTQTITTPTPIDSSEPDYIGRLRTTMHLTPQSRSLYIATEGPVGAIDRSRAKLDIRQSASKVGAELAIWSSNEWENIGQLNLNLGGDGQVEKLKVCKRGFLEALEVNIRNLDLNPDTDWMEIVDPKQQAFILGATAEVLGFEEGWQGLDLRLTASGLYAAMGQRNLDPATVLVPRA